MKKYLFGLLVIVLVSCFLSNLSYAGAGPEIIPGVVCLDYKMTMRQVLLDKYSVVLPKPGSSNYSPKFDKKYQYLMVIKGELPEKFNGQYVRWSIGQNPDRNAPEDQIHYLFFQPCK
jgi:hypothetical protein